MPIAISRLGYVREISPADSPLPSKFGDNWIYDFQVMPTQEDAAMLHCFQWRVGKHPPPLQAIET